VAGFGENGSINLKTPEVMVTGMAKPYSMTSPPVIWGHLVITGSAVGEAIGGAVGDVRAWDARTGKLVWTVHSVPQKGEPNEGTWARESGHNRSGVNVWGEMTVDAKRGIVYLPFGAPADDRVGVDRPGTTSTVPPSWRWRPRRAIPLAFPGGAS
jgi:quinoprotein glucose dehydrogenase